jgi:NADH:ubiquinone oxidoreductase subunit
MDDIPRHEQKNPFNYTSLELAERKKAIRDATKDYPNVPEGWIEWMYDLIKNIPEEEIKDIINNKKWEDKPKERDAAGTIVCGTIE